MPNFQFHFPGRHSRWSGPSASKAAAMVGHNRISQTIFLLRNLAGRATAGPDLEAVTSNIEH